VVSIGACADDATSPPDSDSLNLVGTLRFEVVARTNRGEEKKAYVMPFETYQRNGVTLARALTNRKTLSLDEDLPVLPCSDDCPEGGDGEEAEVFDMAAAISDIQGTPDSIFHNPWFEVYGPSIPVGLTGELAAAVPAGDQIIVSGQLDTTAVFRIVLNKSGATKPVSQMLGYRNDTLRTIINYTWVQNGTGWLLTGLVGQSFSQSGALASAVSMSVDDVITVASTTSKRDVLQSVSNAITRIAGVFAPADAVAQEVSCVGEGLALGLSAVGLVLATAVTETTAGLAMPVLLLAYAESGTAVYNYARCKEDQRANHQTEAEEQAREEDQERRLKELEARIKILEEAQEENEP
jgi:hypothetical protein